MITTPLTLNFKEDLRKYILSMLDETYLNDKMNIFPKTSELASLQKENIDSLLNIYINWRNRLLNGRKKKVYCSNQLYKNSSYGKFKKDIIKLKRIFTTGGCIRPFLSHYINKIKFNDNLLLDWGIHHLHFVPNCSTRGLGEGTESLFILAKEDEIYFIDIFNHQDFEKLKILEYLYENWAEVLDSYKLNGVSSDRKYTEEEIKNLRKNDVAYCISFDENTYAPTLNTNSRVNTIIKVDYLLKFIERFEDIIYTNADIIKKEIEEKTGHIINELNLELVLDSKAKKALIKEKELNIGIVFDKNIEDLNNILNNINIF